ncbi:MAG: 23S rRNA (uracil(1939)-C(5))-methyltransferase RlmD [Candidatus Eisenbacteria bacterium]|nr:23S rRNA (uracil(1939)-C(5))-methyltransferase RlmD [Candidatus Eisenbacteria bacterium]
MGIEHPRADSPAVGRTVEALIHDLAYGGAGVARVGGWVLMVPGAFPGERVTVHIRRKRKGLFEGDLLAVLETSPDREPLACPHASICGGCALQGLSPLAQTRWKNVQARELLRRIGRVEPEIVEEPWSAPQPWFYRNKMEFTFSRRPWIEKERLLAQGAPTGGPALGLHPRGLFSAVFDVDDCRLQSALSNAVVKAVRRAAVGRSLEAYDSRRDAGFLRHLVVRRPADESELLIMLVARCDDPVLDAIAGEAAAEVPAVTGAVAAINTRRATVAQGDYERPMLGDPCWHESVAGVRFQIGASSFFQIQAPGAEALVETAIAWLSPSRGDRILDLYCGAGTFSLPLARRCARVVGVESFAQAVAQARENAAANGIDAEFVCAEVEERGAPGWLEERWDAVLLDPPRSGLHPRALERLRAVGAPRILYVSCNPATLARDTGLLTQEAGYLPRRLKVFDLFPQTPHLESMLLLER